MSLLAQAAGSRPPTAATARLRTPRLELRPFTEELISARYVGWLNDPAVVRFSEQRHRTHTPASCLDYVRSIDQKSAHLWAIFHGDAHIGNISAHRDPWNATADIGILIGERSSQNAGLGGEAWQAVCDWLIATGIRKVTAGAMASNLPMLKVFRKTGMAEEARLRDQFLLDGEPIDMILVARFVE